MKRMIYKSIIGELDLSNITRLYPAAVVDMQGEVAEMSLEWIDLYGDKVKILKYVLVFDFTPLHEDVKDRKILEFETKEALIAEMSEVAKLFEK
jgi:hypothetical protein